MKIKKQQQQSQRKTKAHLSSSSSSSSSSSAHPVLKRLLSGSPKSSNEPARSSSGSRSRSLSPTLSDCPRPSLKKTRDLPDMSQCHCCGFRIDTANGKQRLHNMYSEWRIVLLCKKCTVRVESSEICSYCFRETLAAECLCCGECKHSIHRDCFLKYRSVAPWSYSCSGEDFSVCVDCWVPRPIAVSRAVSRSMKIRRQDKSGEKSRDSGVLDGVKSLEDVAQDANCVAEKKIEAAAKAREEAMRKAIVARRMVELATNALDFVARKDESGEKGEVIDDTELAFQLNRAMNGSPRIWNLGEGKGDSLVRGSPFGEPSLHGKLEPEKHAVEPLVCIRSLKDDSLIDEDCLKPDGKIKMRIGDKDAECQVKRDAEDLGGKMQELGSCSIKWIDVNGDENCMDSANRPCHKRNEPALPKDERCVGKPDGYLLKYCRRNVRSYIDKEAQIFPELQAWESN